MRERESEGRCQGGTSGEDARIMRLTALTYSGLYEYEYWCAGAIRKKTEKLPWIGLYRDQLFFFAFQISSLCVKAQAKFY